MLNNHLFWFQLYRFLEIVYILGSETERLALSWMQPLLLDLFVNNEVHCC